MVERVKCPICGNRLFDKDTDQTAELVIKCIKCSGILELKMYPKDIAYTRIIKCKKTNKD